MAGVVQGEVGHAGPGGDGRGEVGPGGHDLGGGAGEGQDKDNGQDGLNDLFQDLGTAGGGHAAQAQEVPPDDGGNADQHDRGGEGLQRPLDAIHFNNIERDKVRPEEQGPGADQADAEKQDQGCAEDAVGLGPVAQGDLGGDEFRDGVGDAHGGQRKQQGIDLKPCGIKTVANVPKAGDIGDDETID